MGALKKLSKKSQTESKRLNKELEELGIIYSDKAKKTKDNPFFTTLLSVVVPKIVKATLIYGVNKAADATVDAISKKINGSLTKKV